jgi:hypothetical protein
MAEQEGAAVKLKVDTSDLRFVLVGGPDPVLEFGTQEARTDDAGVPLFAVRVVAIGDEAPELLTITAPGQCDHGGHEHEWGPPQEGTRRCQTDGCPAMQHQHAAVLDEQRGWICTHCEAWLSAPPSDGLADPPAFPPRKPKDRTPRRERHVHEAKPNRARRHLKAVP